jgi:hypothetical protein
MSTPFGTCIRQRRYQRWRDGSATCRPRKHNIMGKNTFTYVCSFKYAPHGQAPSLCATPSGLLLPGIVAGGDEYVIRTISSVAWELAVKAEPSPFSPYSPRRVKMGSEIATAPSKMQ